ncbi:hypothetical protein CISIN_1g029405mg [Citrus sinensis]|uniref:Uncharacterized protein n=1 Tax=Citrus sinensis TaxID=2711 RepID=A0A067E813_CITSI|nr:hypothetical protein CISIN_1g029405mg [Citrus sinensis]KDO50021.1 hypothetical protein CISIN_1g029405mg [Citrus sinensis]
MRILPISGEALVCLLVALLFAVNFCHGSDSKTVEVVGSAECADCARSNIKPSEAFSGLRVTIDCKQENGNGGFKTRGTGELDVEGEFKEDCYAQLHSASGTPCPAYGGLESSKLVLKVKTNEKHTFGLAKNKKLKFSPPICASSTAAYTRPSPIRPPVPTPPFWRRCRLCGRRRICCQKV